MARFVSGECPTKSSEECRKLKRVIGATKEDYVLLCEACGTEFQRERPEVMKRTQRYPYFNDSLGVALKNEEHEKHYVEENGFKRREESICAK